MARCEIIFCILVIPATIYGFSPKRTNCDDDGYHESALFGNIRGAVSKLYKSRTQHFGKGDIKTTLWYYNSQGPNYKFTIDGDVPARPENMIKWLESNSKYYKLTPVEYMADTEDAPEISRPNYAAAHESSHVTTKKPTSHPVTTVRTLVTTRKTASGGKVSEAPPLVRPLAPAASTSASQPAGQVQQQCLCTCPSPVKEANEEVINW